MPQLSRIRTLGLAVAMTAAASSALAQGEGHAAAEALFQEGRALFEQGKFAEGCPKLAESQRLDPATGTLLALALCHEGEGKLATAWAEFTTVAGQARLAGRDDRETVARERAAALRARLSTLTVVVSPAVARTPGLEVRVDGKPMGTASYGVAMPVDGGEHRIDATAPGKRPFTRVVMAKSESDAIRTEVPGLVEAAPAPRSASASETAPPETTKSGADTRIPALVAAGAGVILVGVGTYLALDAKSDYDAADEKCGGSTCPRGPYEATEDARSQGTVATVLFAVGGAAIAAGAVLWFLPSSDRDGTSPSAGARMEGVGVGPGGVSIAGTF